MTSTNPNAARPTLTLSRRPMALAAFRAKLKLMPDPETPAIVNGECGTAMDGSEGKPPEHHNHPPVQRREEDVVRVRLEPKATVETRPPRKPPAAAQPFVCISGAVSIFPLSWTTGDERRAALGRWLARVAREVGKQYQTKSERDAAEAFVRGHRLSIANAFERRLCRKDVVEAMGEMFRARAANGEAGQGPSDAVPPG